MRDFCSHVSRLTSHDLFDTQPLWEAIFGNGFPALSLSHALSPSHLLRGLVALFRQQIEGLVHRQGVDGLVILEEALVPSCFTYGP